MQAAVSMEMPWLQQWAGAGQDRSFQGFSSAGRAVVGRDSSTVCSGVPDSWDFPGFHPSVTLAAALELVCSPVNKTSFFTRFCGGFSKAAEPALWLLLGREMVWEQGVVVRGGSTFPGSCFQLCSPLLSPRPCFISPVT